jgi:hypothetical protein
MMNLDTSNLNLYPDDIFSLLRELAIEAGLSTQQLDGIVQLGGYTYVSTTGTGTKRKRELDHELFVNIPRDRYLDGLESQGVAMGEDLANLPHLMKRNIYTGLVAYFISHITPQAHLYYCVALIFRRL